MGSSSDEDSGLGEGGGQREGGRGIFHQEAEAGVRGEQEGGHLFRDDDVSA